MQNHFTFFLVAMSLAEVLAKRSVRREISMDDKNNESKSYQFGNYRSILAQCRKNKKCSEITVFYPLNKSDIFHRLVLFYTVKITRYSDVTSCIACSV